MSRSFTGAQHRLLSEHGMLLVLLLLCAFFSAVTWDEQHPGGAQGGAQLAAEIASDFASPSVLVVARDSVDDVAFADALARELEARGIAVVATVKGGPADARRAIEVARDAGREIDVFACNHVTAAWGVFAGLPVVEPESYSWPDFLKADNLLNVANQIAVIAILAIGMTLVIVTGGIDLSVGSLVALSAVVSTLLIRDLGGAENAGVLAMVLCAVGGISVCALAGAFSGVVVTLFAVPPFIGTLGMMLVASGFAYIVSQGQSINEVPDSFTWLGRGAGPFAVPNAVFLMILLYAAAHVLMTRTALGRYVYAVGGNREAARLSGVPVRSVLLFVYTACGALAGVGGVVMASQLKSGAPTYGSMYELYVIAAVVVGGTSLAGGQGKVMGTLVGALIIAVIQNGMNLTGVESYTQKVVLGLVILGAVLLDTAKRRAGVG